MRVLLLWLAVVSESYEPPPQAVAHVVVGARMDKRESYAKRCAEWGLSRRNKGKSKRAGVVIRQRTKLVSLRCPRTKTDVEVKLVDIVRSS